ncbi:MAG: cell envelope integrity protein CreD, partial [Myxococcota bacterium]
MNLKKVSILAGLCCLLTIPCFLLSSLARERKLRKSQVTQDIALSWTRKQKFLGPFLVIPYRIILGVEQSKLVSGKQPTSGKQPISGKQPTSEHQTGAKTAFSVSSTKGLGYPAKKTNNIRYARRKIHMVLPATLNIQGEILTQRRYRGIYRVPVYTAKLRGKGSFVVPSWLKDARIQKPYLAFGVLDNRGIRKMNVTWHQRELNIVPGSGLKFHAMGAHAPLTLDAKDVGTSHTFRFALDIQGMETFHFVPVGQHTQVSLRSAWKNPSFLGKYLPEKRHVKKKGFQALWNISSLASNVEQHFQNCAKRQYCSSFLSNSFGVSFLEMVDIYQQTERSLKYSLLFIGLTFVFFVLFEMLKQLR